MAQYTVYTQDNQRNGHAQREASSQLLDRKPEVGMMKGERDIDVPRSHRFLQWKVFLGNSPK